MPERNETLLEVRNLRKYFPVRRGVLSRVVANVQAVDDVSFSIQKGETFGLVGESGCGKTTTGRAVLRLIEPDAGEIRFDGVDLLKLSAEELRLKRRDMQIVFQDPYASLNPRMKIRTIVGEPFAIHKMLYGSERDAQVAELLRIVGLDPSVMDRYPHEFSGGQRQRIGIARALALKPKLIVADEPVSALDVSIQAQVGTAEQVCLNPKHPYTQALISSVPVPDPAARKERIVLKGDVPTPLRPPPGCRFHTRCPIAEERCRIEEPLLRVLDDGRSTACHFTT
jgi:oligopeptide transport system ATP-binding protein